MPQEPSNSVQGHVGAHRRYFIFVHYKITQAKTNPERNYDDYWWTEPSGPHFTEAFEKRLTSDMDYLARVLAPLHVKCMDDANVESWEGRAFLFMDIGWENLVLGDKDDRRFMMHLQRIHDDLARLKENRVQVQIIDSCELLDLLEVLERNLDEETRGKYSRFLVGGLQRMRYDAPKVAEAAIRIANIGRQIPVFRFDEDVILCRTDQLQAETIRQSIALLCQRYVEVNRNPYVHYFVFSGFYSRSGKYDELPNRMDPLLDSDIAKADMLNGFATRVVQLAELPSTPDELLAAMRGLEPDPPCTAPFAKINSDKALTFLRGLHEYGANPFRQVISGAGLCLSDGAILDLPPYSNMRFNVVWIDDHLKYSLHHELGHFDIHIGEVGHACVDDAQFPQMRHDMSNTKPKSPSAPKPPTYADVKWHMSYLLRLLMGCVADAWLRKLSSLKQALTSAYSPDHYFRLRRFLADNMPYVYADKYFEVMRWNKWMDPKELRKNAPSVQETINNDAKEAFRKQLWDKALERLDMVAKKWSAPGFQGTFLGMFATGEVPEGYSKDLLDYLPPEFGDGLKKEIEKLKNSKFEKYGLVQYKNDLEKATLGEALHILIDDFVDYFEVVRFWKYFVSSVRFLLNDSDHDLKAREKISLKWMFPPDEIKAENQGADNAPGEGA